MLAEIAGSDTYTERSSFSSKHLKLSQSYEQLNLGVFRDMFMFGTINSVIYLLPTTRPDNVWYSSYWTSTPINLSGPLTRESWVEKSCLLLILPENLEQSWKFSEISSGASKILWIHRIVEIYQLWQRYMWLLRKMENQSKCLLSGLTSGFPQINAGSGMSGYK